MPSTSPQLSRLAVAIVFMASGYAHAGELRQELGHLRDSHPLLKASEFAVQAASERVIAAQGGFLPKINISADTGTERLVSQASSSSAAVESDFDREKYSVSIEQNLFNGGRTLGGVRLAQTEEEIKELERRSLFQDVTLEALIAYLQVLRSQLLIELAQANEEITLSQLEMEKKRVEKGSGIAVDELQASTRLQIVRERRVFYEQGMRDALAAYEQVFGRAPNAEELQDLDHYLTALPADLDAALANGLSNNPKVRLTNLQSQRAERTLSIERSSYYPNIDLVGTRNREEKVGGSFSKEEDSVLVKFSWNIFSGGESYRRARAAAFDLSESQERETNTKRKTSETIRLAWNQYQKGLERLKLLEEASATSKKVMDGRKKLRDSGKETVLAVLDAEVEYFGVLANMVNAMVDARLGSYRLLHSIGELDMRALNVETNEFKLPVKPVKDVIRELIGKGHLDSAPGTAPAAPPVRQAQIPETPLASTTPEPMSLADQLIQQASSLAPELAKDSEPPKESEPAKASEQSTRGQPSTGGQNIPTEQVLATPVEPSTSSEAPMGPSVSALNESPQQEAVTESVSEDQGVQDQGAQYLASIEESVSAWVEAWSQKDFQRYANFYSEQFVTEKFSDRDAWLNHRKPRVLGKRTISIDISDLELLQRNDGPLEVQFVQFYQSGGLEVRSRKKLLFVQEDSGWKIIWEGNASDKVIVREAPALNEPSTTAPEEISEVQAQPLVAEAEKTPEPEPEPVAVDAPSLGEEVSAVIPQDTIFEKVNGWAASWSSKDFQRYAEHYSNSFNTSQFGDLDSWLAYRKPRILGKPSILVEVSDLVINQVDAERIEVEFTQIYEGGRLSVRSRKKVILQNEPAGLKIIWEGNA
jgi:adhesin transport system outer membrane protein